MALVAFTPAALAQEAADDDTYAAAEPAPESNDTSGGGWDYDWSGSYLGVSAAMALGQQEALSLGGITANSDDLTGTGLGLYLGQNHHFTKFVVGTEMDFTKADLGGSFDVPGSPLACATIAFDCSTNIGWYGSFRGRAGVAFNSFLPYVTAGVAVAGVESHFSGPLVDKNVSGLGLGWVLGAGVEYAVMKNLVVRGEALHYELSDVTDTILGSNVSVDPQFSLVRVGLGLKF